MSDPMVIGLDLSLTCTGMCRSDGITTHLAQRASGDKRIAIWRRQLEKALNVRDWAAADIETSTLVVIEDIGTDMVNTGIALSKVHTVIENRVRLMRAMKVSPKQLKRFAVSNGNAAKERLHDAALDEGWDGPPRCTCCTARQKQWSSMDESDAWWLWALGRHWEGDPVVADTQARASVMRLLRGTA
jgi:hypothetical protein